MKSWAIWSFFGNLFKRLKMEARDIVNPEEDKVNPEFFNALSPEIKEAIQENKRLTFLPIPAEQEPLKDNRFVVEGFPGIPSYIISKLQYDEGRDEEHESRFYMTCLCVVGFMQDIVNLSENKEAFNVSIETLDPTGVPMIQIFLEGAKIDAYDFLNDFDYASDDISLAKFFGTFAKKRIEVLNDPKDFEVILKS